MGGLEMPINNKTLRDANWKQVYRYVGKNTGFITYACDAIPGLTITKDLRGAKVVKTTYTIQRETGGAKADSPAQAIRYYNAEQKRKSGRPEVPGSPKSRSTV
jgi:hypothetical protein